MGIYVMGKHLFAINLIGRMRKCGPRICFHFIVVISFPGFTIKKETKTLEIMSLSLTFDSRTDYVQ